MGRSNGEKVLKKKLKEKGVKFWYEPCKIPYVLKKNYIPDFVLDDGKLKKPKKPLTPEDLLGKVLIEYKGYFKLDDQYKMVAVKESNPDLDIRFLFEKDNFCYPKGRKKRSSNEMRYSDWCIKYGFPFAFNEIPEEWFE